MTTWFWDRKEQTWWEPT